MRFTDTTQSHFFFFLLFVHSFKFKVIFKCVEKNKNNFKNVMFYLKPIVMF